MIYSEEAMIQAERAVVAGLMIDEDAWSEVADIVSPIDFNVYSNRLIFETISRLASKNVPIDIISVSDVLGNKLKEIGGLVYLAEITAQVSGTKNIKSYAEIVKKHSLLRELSQLTTDLIEKFKGKSFSEPEEIISEIENRLFEISDRGKKPESARNIYEVSHEVIEKAEKMLKSGGKMTGIPTGFLELDKITSGLQPSELIVVAGRPSMGKTAFAMRIAEHVVTRTDKTVLVFSMEMSVEQLATRLIASMSHIYYKLIEMGNLRKDEWEQVTQTIMRLERTRLLVDDSPTLTVSDIKARCKRIKKTAPLDLVIVDYLQLIPTSGKENRATQVAAITRDLKILARELKVPVVVLSQLNRSLELRVDKRPILSDLRDSGGIEQDADLVIFLYREEVYNENTNEKGIAEIIIGKHRNGPTGTIKLDFVKLCARFDNII